MKSISIITVTTILLFVFSRTALSQDQPSADSTIVTQPDTTGSQVTTEPVDTTVDPVNAQIISIINEVNTRSALVDKIISEGDIKIKTPTIDQSASIEIHARKKDDVWFDITGTFGVRGAMAHFNRKTFVFFNSLNDEVIMGSTNVLNIGSVTKIRCTFDDLLNSFTGTVRIPRGKSDTLSMSDEGNQYVVALRTGTVTRKYWVDKNNYSVYKYIYVGKSGSTIISFEFSNFSDYGTASYAKKIEIRRPKKQEYFSLTLDNVNLNQTNVSFSVEYPNDVVVKHWK